MGTRVSPCNKAFYSPPEQLAVDRMMETQLTENTQQTIPEPGLGSLDWRVVWLR